MKIVTLFFGNHFPPSSNFLLARSATIFSNLLTNRAKDASDKFKNCGKNKDIFKTLLLIKLFMNSNLSFVALYNHLLK